MHTRPERRAGRRRPFWLSAAGCAAGCVKARGLSSVCPRFSIFRPVQVDRRATTPTGLWKVRTTSLSGKISFDGSTHRPESVSSFCDEDCSRRRQKRKRWRQKDQRPGGMGSKLVKVFTIRAHGERDLRQYGMVEATVIAQSRFDKRRRASPEWIGVRTSQRAAGFRYGDASPATGRAQPNVKS